MKRCPSCQRTYEDDSQTFCFVDGGRLLDEGQAYDSRRTLVAPPTPSQPPDPTQYYSPDKQTGPNSPYPTQGNQSPSWPQAGGGQSGQQAWPAPPIPQPPPQQQTPAWGAPQPQSPYQQSAPSASVSAEGQRRGLGIAALVLGVLSIQNALFMTFRWAFPYSPMRAVTLFMALTGLILGAIALTLTITNSSRHAGRGHALAGIITSFLGLFIIFLGGPRY
jgi:hypothetical protein